MYTVCSWCGKTIHFGDAEKGISHGTCKDCAKELEQLEKNRDSVSEESEENFDYSNSLKNY